MEKMEETSEITEVKVGEFKQPIKMKYFIGSKSNIKFSSKEALIFGKYLTGLGYDKVQFLLTIVDEETCNFDVYTEGIEVDKETRGRLLSLISEKTIIPTSFNNEMIVKELEFNFKLSDKDISVFLAVDVEKPIDKLNSILSSEVEISKEHLSKLDLLFGDDDFETVEDNYIDEESNEESNEDTIEDTPVDSNQKVDTLLVDTFDKMRQQKIEELQFELNELKLNLRTTEMDIITKNAHKSKLSERKSLLETRLSNLLDKEGPNGYYFYVSEMKNESEILDQKTIDIIKNKLSKIKSINTDAFISLFKDGEYSVYFGKIDEEGNFEIVKEFKDDISEKLDFLVYDDGEFIYQGELDWHQVVDKLIKLGFSQDTKFDELFSNKK
jgi:hypothetical protein